MRADADRADGRHARRRRHRLPAHLRLRRGLAVVALGPRRRRLGRDPRQRAPRLLGSRRAGRVGMDAADLPDPAGRPAVAARRSRSRRRASTAPGAWRTFVDHTLPMLAPVLAVAIVLRTIDAFTTFDQVYVLTHGGPGTATQLISIYGYDTFFRFQQYGYAAAMLLMVALVVLAFAFLAVRLMRRQASDGMKALRPLALVAGRDRRARAARLDGRDLAQVQPRDHAGRHALPAHAVARELPQPVLGPRLRLAISRTPSASRR